MNTHHTLLASLAIVCSSTYAAADTQQEGQWFTFTEIPTFVLGSQTQFMFACASARSMLEFAQQSAASPSATTAAKNSIEESAEGKTDCQPICGNVNLTDTIFSVLAQWSEDVPTYIDPDQDDAKLGGKLHKLSIYNGTVELVVFSTAPESFLEDYSYTTETDQKTPDRVPEESVAACPWPYTNSS